MRFALSQLFLLLILLLCLQLYNRPSIVICMDKSSLFKAAHLEARASISVGEYTNYSFAFRQALKLMYARRKPMEQRIAELASDNPKALISYHLWS